MKREEVPPPGVVPEPWETGELCPAQSVPSGWLALELDTATADSGRLSDRELVDAVVGFERIVAWAGARQARLLAEFAGRRPPETSGGGRSDRPAQCGEFAADEIGLALSLTRTTANARLTMAHTLARDLPATLGAWESGQIDMVKARSITDTAAVLPKALHPGLEARVLPRAPQQTHAQVRAALSRAVLALDPHGAAGRHREARRERRVVVTPEPDGMASLWALLPAPAAVAAYEQLSRLARGLGAADPRGMDARRADLLADLLTGHTTSPGNGITDPTHSETATPPSTGGSKPLVQVTVPITTLLSLDEYPGELAGYGPIPADLAREIAAEGTWRRLLTDPVSGVLLDRGRRTYTPPPRLADYIRARDQHCRFPTCGHPATHTDLDHTVPYHGGGTTSPHNLAAYCRHHHRAKTHGTGWHTRQDPDGQITWTTPTRHHHTSHPHDYRPNPPPPNQDPPPGSDRDRSASPPTPADDPPF